MVHRSPPPPCIPLRNAWILSRLRLGDIESAMVLIREALDTVRVHLGPVLYSHRTQQERNHRQLHLGFVDGTLAADETSLCFLCPCQITSQHGHAVDLLQCSSQDLKLVLLSLFYNLGLCYQFRVITHSGPDKWSKNVRHAIAMYSIGINIVSAMEQSDEYDTSLAAIIRPFAVFMGNNLAALFSETYQWKKFEKSVEWTLQYAQEGVEDDLWLTCNIWAHVHLWKSMRSQASAAA